MSEFPNPCPGGGVYADHITATPANDFDGRVTCRTCGRDVAVNSAGRMVDHSYPDEKVCEVRDCPGYGTPHAPIEPPEPVWSVQVEGNVTVELDQSHCIVIHRHATTQTGADVEITVGNVELMIAGLRDCLDVQKIHGGERIDRWHDDLIQFARLLAEINATQDTLDDDALCESMDLEPGDIRELFDRADNVWERAKGNR